MTAFQRREKRTFRGNSEEEEAGARAKALALLSDMDRTEKGLTDRLIRAGFSREAAENALAYVKSFGYVDDERYALRFIELARGGKSRTRIRYDLISRGIRPEEADRALERSGEWDERDLIRRLARKKLAKYPADDSRAREKTAASLARAGFRIPDIAEVLDSMEE